MSPAEITVPWSRILYRPTRAATRRPCAFAATDAVVAAGGGRPRRRRRRHSERVIGFWGGLAVIVGITIGSGIFRKPHTLARDVGDPAAILGLWVGFGLVSLCGALALAELSSMLPHTGGVYVFLRAAYGDAAAFVFGWLFLLVSTPAAIGALATFFAELLLGLLGRDPGARRPGRVPAVAGATILVLSVVNLLGARMGSAVQSVFAFLKVGALLALMLASFTVPGAASPTCGPRRRRATSACGAASVIWAYDGWVAVSMVAGEVRGPREDDAPGHRRRDAAHRAPLRGRQRRLLLRACPWRRWPRRRRRPPADHVRPPRADRAARSSPPPSSAACSAPSTGTSWPSRGSRMPWPATASPSAFLGPRAPALGDAPRRDPDPRRRWRSCSWPCCATSTPSPPTSWSSSGRRSSSRWPRSSSSARRRPDAPRPFRTPGYPLVPLVFLVGTLAGLVAIVWGEIDRPVPNYAPLWGLLLAAAGFPVYAVWRRLATCATRARRTALPTPFPGS